MLFILGLLILVVAEVDHGSLPNHSLYLSGHPEVYTVIIILIMENLFQSNLTNNNCKSHS